MLLKCRIADLFCNTLLPQPHFSLTPSPPPKVSDSFLGSCLDHADIAKLQASSPPLPTSLFQISRNKWFHKPQPTFPLPLKKNKSKPKHKNQNTQTSSEGTEILRQGKSVIQSTRQQSFSGRNMTLCLLHTLALHSPRRSFTALGQF